MSARLTRSWGTHLDNNYFFPDLLTQLDDALLSNSDQNNVTFTAENNSVNRPGMSFESDSVLVLDLAPAEPVWENPVALTQLPLAGDPRINQGFGGQTSHTKWLKYSIDFSAISGTDVMAVADGTIVGVRSNSTGIDLAYRGIGNFITVLHTGGFYATYAHLSSTDVTVNQPVGAGQVIGESGSSGGYKIAGVPTKFPQHLHVTFGTSLLGPDGKEQANGSDATGSPAFFLSDFSTAAETSLLVDPSDPLELRSTDIFGTSESFFSKPSESGLDQDHLTGSSKDNRIFGGSGNDRLEGKGGFDILVGGSGDDKLYGGLHQDVLIGGKGADHLDGGLGRDFADYRTSKGIVLDLLDPNRSSGEAHGDTFANIEIFLGSQKKADIMRGDSLENLFVGLGGNDTLNGRGGDDSLFGAAGQDALVGGGGNDRLFGGKGMDALVGGDGNDTLTGGKGPDTFVFKRGHDRDTINDFSDAEDVLDLSDFNFDSVAKAKSFAENVGGNTVFDFGGGDVLELIDISRWELDRNDFFL